MDDTYKTISTSSEGIFKDKGSKFLAYAFPVESEMEVKEILAQIKKDHHSARHHCYAWRIGSKNPSYRANDDGEPSSTAGKPILGQLLSYDLTNILVIVVRYFGGTLLGTSGLINAYRTATITALQNADIETRTIEELIKIQFSYPEMNAVMQVIKQENLNIINTVFELNCQVDITVRESEVNKIVEIFNSIPKVTLIRTNEDE
ncbi:MAG TPA: YigZ family protein [Mariniphaga sp.]|nr:YigZ family protein [Mariniphaga sp.]